MVNADVHCVFPQSQEASNICHLTGNLLLKVGIERTGTNNRLQTSTFVSCLFRRRLTLLLTPCEGLHLSGVRLHEIQDVIPAAAVQLAALQPVALVQPGPDVSAAAGVRLNNR